MPDKFDIAIIGGGISGLGIALLASQQGYSVFLAEKGRCAEATSNNSLRIIHGGLRYLQTFNFARVSRSLKAQAELISCYPDLIKPLPCLMPLSKCGLKSKFFAKIGLKLYSLFPGHANRCPPGIIESQRIEDEVKLLTGHAPYGAMLWYDALLLDPVELVSSIKKQSVQSDAQISEETKVESVTKTVNDFELNLNSQKNSKKILAKVVINTSGPWLRTIHTSGIDLPSPEWAWCKGFNLVLKRQLESKYAIGLESAEKRLYFLVPRAGGSVLGTQYTEALDDGLKIESRIVEKFLAGFNQLLPEAALKLTDVEQIEVGKLPIDNAKSNELNLIGSERLYDRGGYIEVLSTKYTTFLSQARKVLSICSSYL